MWMNAFDLLKLAEFKLSRSKSSCGRFFAYGNWFEGAIISFEKGYTELFFGVCSSNFESIEFPQLWRLPFSILI